jgi:hypothetical protein
MVYTVAGEVIFGRPDTPQRTEIALIARRIS